MDSSTTLQALHPPADPGASTTLTSSTAPTTFNAPTRASHSHVRSCLCCRRRKVRCNRQQPCTNCVRTATDCIYPPGPGRAPRKPRRMLDARLLDGLSRLESIIRRLDDQGNSNTAGSPLPAVSQSPGDQDDGSVVGLSPSNAHSTSSPPSRSSSNLPLEPQSGRLVIDETRSCYISNVLWASLGDEIEELRDLLHEPISEDEDYTPTEDSVLEYAAVPLGPGSSAAILGFGALAYSLRAYHPSLSQSVALLEIFKENVAPLVRIFHMPTLIQIYWDAIGSLDSDTLEKNAEALLFAIYYAAVISMEPEQCLHVLGTTRTRALGTYLFAVEQAMARANLLNTQNMILLQAAVLFLFALRNEDDSRTVWSLTALVFHIAQAMGLHRDGTVFGLKPLEIELRRRLWWHICLLDNRSSEYHGCEPIVRESVFDTKLPLNINDSDLTADMVDLPPERTEATEMTFCLIRCEAMRVVWKIGYMPPNMGTRKPGWSANGGLSLQNRESLAKELQHQLEDRYLKYCDPSIPFFLVSATVGRLIIARTWLVVYYPQKSSEVSLPEILQDQLFKTSIEVLELSSLLFTNKDISKWNWHSKTHIQWHAVAFVLSEICSRPPSPDCDRAWKHVSTVYDRWLMKENEKKGTLWRPIARLMAKARYVREMQKTTTTLHAWGHHRRDWRGAGVSTSGVSAAAVVSSVPTPESLSAASASASQSVSAVPVISGALGGAMQDSHSQDILSMDTLNPLMEMFPDNNTSTQQIQQSEAAPFGMFGTIPDNDAFAQIPGYMMTDGAGGLLSLHPLG